MSSLYFYGSSLRTCRYFLKIAYIGSNYKGVQRQSRRDSVVDENYHDGTVQGALEHALNRALTPVYGSRIALSSRTDAGVHAYMNSLNVDLTHPLPNTRYKPSFVTEATNKVLAYNQHEITVLETRLVPSYFHSRINALWRRYLYRVAVIVRANTGEMSLEAQYHQLRHHLPVFELNRCHVVGQVDLDLIRKCGQLFTGEHNFACFSTKDSADKNKSTIKLIDQFEVRVQPSAFPSLIYLEFYIQAKSFLYNQIRRMVAAALDVGQKRTSLEEIGTLLRSGQRQSATQLSQMVPACGLYLIEVGYDDNDMIIAEDDDGAMHYSPKSYYRENFFDAC